MKQWAKKWGISLLAILLAAIFPAIFLYASNSNEADFSEILLPAAAFAVTAILLFGISFLLTRHTAKSAIIAILFVLLLENYAAVESAVKAVFPGLRYWHILPILLFLFLNIAIAIVKWMPSDLSGIVTTVACVVFGALIVVNGVIAIPGEINKSNARRLEQEQQQAEEAEKESEADADALPNVYLLIFDEFAGFNQIRDFYGYENEDLINFLEEHNFTISYDSQNPSTMTTTVTTNLVNLEYIVDNSTPDAEKEVYRHNGYLFDLMEEYGYTVRKVSDRSFFGTPDVEVTEIKDQAVTISGETLEDIFWAKTAVYPFAAPEVSVNYPTIEYMSDPNNIPENMTFTLFYLVSPHTPFFYDENGNINLQEHWRDWEDPRYYLGQYKYVSALMIEVLENLVENDPDALIMTMSDHGARYAPGTDPGRRNNHLQRLLLCGRGSPGIYGKKRYQYYSQPFEFGTGYRF